MPGPSWNSDHPEDAGLLVRNARALLAELPREASTRPAPSVERAHAWHRRLYDGAHGIPGASYLGDPRDSDPDVPDPIGYEVAIGAPGHAIGVRPF